ncbi:MAG: thiamine pyrophosphate-dependent enzyme [Gammaproteobacteria bacterium]|nr:thiamine pyrophosphate-dependent enzyme [Gammaproteobacteria bacterium]MCW9055287.1 thiamine pyrophosphate-dependent enzyme [Gammaproteobacteria bacterium]
MCAGCGGLEALNQVYDIVGDKSVFVNAAGCMTLLSVYPYTPFRGSWIYTAMGSAPAGAQGVRDALDILLDKNRIGNEDDMEVVVLTGDGSAYGMGMSATSGTLDRDLDYLYLCYDNEGYGNTGQQFSAATPHGAKTATSKGPHGYPGFKKDLFEIWAAHKPAYVATIIGAEPVDLARKIEKAMSMKGPRMLIALSPCPTGWDFDPKETVNIGKLAVKTGIWPLKEYVDGKIIHTKIPRERKPVEDYLKLQGRFKHLFEPQRDDELINEIQQRVDRYWEDVS